MSSKCDHRWEFERLTAGTFFQWMRCMDCGARDFVRRPKDA
jgi:hypothetical protein